jgi:nucleoside phosphorylase
MNPEFLIVTPLVEEWNAVCRRITNPEFSENECRGLISKYFVVCVLTGVGEERNTAFITNSIIKWQPHWIILAGITAGLKRAKLGDIILATHIYGYNFGKIEYGKYLHGTYRLAKIPT